MTQHPLADALRTARNRLQRLALEIPQDTSLRADAFDWADEATKALAQYEKSDTDRDQLRDALAAAYSQGATDVHKVWSSESDPDFGEAASDYASHAIAALASKTAIDPAVIRLPERPGADLIDILGRPNFACIGLANILRKNGWDIPNKSETEQANVILFTLRLWAKYGKDWAEKADEEIAAIRALGKDQ